VRLYDGHSEVTGLGKWGKQSFVPSKAQVEKCHLGEVPDLFGQELVRFLPGMDVRLPRTVREYPAFMVNPVVCIVFNYLCYSRQLNNVGMSSIKAIDVGIYITCLMET
jgi:hypothetical protein